MIHVQCVGCGATSPPIEDIYLDRVDLLIKCAAAIDVLANRNILHSVFGPGGSTFPVCVMIGSHYYCGKGRYRLHGNGREPVIIETDTKAVYNRAAAVLGLPPANVVQDMLEDITQGRPPRVFRPSPGSRLIRRIVPRDDPVLLEEYSELMATQPDDAVVVEDTTGVFRWQQSGLVRHLDYCGAMNINDLSVAFWEGKFSLQEYMDLYRGLGYSLSGFEEVFGRHLKLHAEDAG